jgi:hypothetical protein
VTVRSGERTAPAAFVSYLDALRTSVLSPDFRRRIADRERRAEYPFSVQNIYRVLFAAAPALCRGWLELAGRAPLAADDPRLGTSLRCFRYLHPLLVGADSVDPTAAAMLEPIAVRAMRVTGAPACFCPPGSVPPEGPEVEPDVAIRLAAALRQYADIRWLGQHDQGFAGMPPVPAGTQDVAYARCFGRLPPTLGPDNLVVTVVYRLSGGQPLPFDVFRGEVTQPPPRSAVVRASVIDPSAGRALDDAACAGLLRGTVDALRDARQEQPTRVEEGNVVVVDLFTRELFDVARCRGLDPAPWRAEIVDRLRDAGPPGVDGDVGTNGLTEPYLDQLGRCVTRWRGVLCTGG